MESWSVGPSPGAGECYPTPKPSHPPAGRKPPGLRRHARGVGTVRLSGVDHYVGAWPDPEGPPPDAVTEKYHELVARWIAHGRRPLPKEEDARPLLVKDLAARFVVAAEDEYPLGSKEPKNYAVAMSPVVRLFGTLPAAEFRPRHLIEAQAEMVRLGWVRKSLNRSVNRVKRVWRWAAARELVPAATADALRSVEAVRKRHRGVTEGQPRRPATEAEVDAVCAELAAPAAAMLRLLWLTGMRPAEVRGMRESEVDRTGDAWVYRPGSHKTDHSGGVRAVPLGPRARSVLAPWLAACPPGAVVFSPRRLIDRRAEAVRKRNAGSVLTEADVFALSWWPRVPGTLYRLAGECYTADGFACSVAAARKRAGLPDGWSSYCTRHAFKMRVEAGFGTIGAKAALGQKSVETTKLYGVQDLELASKVAAEIG